MNNSEDKETTMVETVIDPIGLLIETLDKEDDQALKEYRGSLDKNKLKAECARSSEALRAALNDLPDQERDRLITMMLYAFGLPESKNITQGDKDE